MSKMEADRMSYLSTATTEDLPPPYEELSRPPSSVLTDISSATITGDPAPTSSRPFPVVFNLYYSWQSNFSYKTSKFLLGEHFEQPSNAVILSPGLKGVEVTIHGGPDTDSAVIATAYTEKAWSKTAIILLAGCFNVDGEPIKEEVKTHAGFANLSYTFSIEVSNADSKPHTENFEWRMSHGKEVKDLDKWSWGWKLVRLDDKSSQSEPSSSSSKRDDRDHGLTSDGKEVVAVWAANSQWSKNKIGKFQFLGSGARGELGEAWAIMAVASVLKVWQGVHMRSKGGWA